MCGGLGLGKWQMLGARYKSQALAASSSCSPTRCLVGLPASGLGCFPGAPGSLPDLPAYLPAPRPRAMSTLAAARVQAAAAAANVAIAAAAAAGALLTRCRRPLPRLAGGQLLLPAGLGPKQRQPQQGGPCRLHLPLFDASPSKPAAAAHCGCPPRVRLCTVPWLARRLGRPRPQAQVGRHSHHPF